MSFDKFVQYLKEGAPKKSKIDLEKIKDELEKAKGDKKALNRLIMKYGGTENKALNDLIREYMKYAEAKAEDYMSSDYETEHSIRAGR